MTTITTLEEMEEIVSQNRNLFWDGWTVIDWRPRAGGQFSVNGLRHKGQWGIAKYRIEPNENGWEVPNECIRSRV